MLHGTRFSLDSPHGRGSLHPVVERPVYSRDRQRGKKRVAPRLPAHILKQRDHGPWRDNVFARKSGAVVNLHVSIWNAGCAQEALLVIQPGGQRSSPSFLFRHCSDRKSTRLNSSHPSISYAVFCLKKKNEAVR